MSRGLALKSVQQVHLPCVQLLAFEFCFDIYVQRRGGLDSVGSHF